MSNTPAAIASPVPEPALARQGDGKSFWAVVGSAYWKSVQTKMASIWVLLVIFLTVFVPFIANAVPFTALIEHVDAQGVHTWVREFPLLKDLTRVDWVWLVWGCAAAILTIMLWWTGKKKIELESLRALRWRWLRWIVAAAIIGSLLIAFFKTDFLDQRDYHAMARDGQLKSVLSAPLKWGYAEQEDKVYAEPGGDHILGTDWTGRDVLARILWGARVVLEIGLVSEVISLIIGAIYGAFMGYFSGTVDIIGMRVLEIVEAIPLLFLLITFVAIFGRQLFMIMVIIGVTGWTGIARFTRAEFLRMRNMDYVSAAKALGLPLKNILFRHMLPNGMTPVIVTFTFGVAGNIVSESILSFLGIGVEPPTASWGSMLDQAGNPGVTFRWWLALPPGIMIFLTVFAYNVMGEGLRDAIDPQTNKIV